MINIITCIYLRKNLQNSKLKLIKYIDRINNKFRPDFS